MRIKVMTDGTSVNTKVYDLNTGHVVGFIEKLELRAHKDELEVKAVVTIGIPKTDKKGKETIEFQEVEVEHMEYKKLPKGVPM